MAKTLDISDDYLISSKNFLLTSVKFWSFISLISVISALVAFSQSNQDVHFGSLNVMASSVLILCLHFTLLLSHKHFRNKRVFDDMGTIKKWALTITAVSIAVLLHDFPEKSEAGLLCVMCIWTDIFAIIQIVRPAWDFFLMHMTFMAIVDRASSLYGFSGGGYWLVMLFGLVVFSVYYVLEDSKPVDVQVKKVDYKES